MYIYIMNRTQIYLTEEEEKVLSDRAKKTGRSKSDLIREAIDAKYLNKRGDLMAFLSVIENTSGAWKRRRESGAEYVERLRYGRLRDLHNRP